MLVRQCTSTTPTTPARTSIGWATPTFPARRAFPLPAAGLRGTCDRAELATLPGARLPTGRLPVLLPWFGSGSAFRSSVAAGERVGRLPQPLARVGSPAQ